MLIQDINYIETVEENAVEGGASVHSQFMATGNLTYFKTGGYASDSELDVYAGWKGFKLSKDVEKAGGGLTGFNLSLFPGAVAGGIAIEADT